MNYFQFLDTVEAVKTRYRELAMQHHPDKGGELATMQEINNQYHAALKALDGQTQEERTYTYKADIEQELMDKLQELLKLRSLEIALIGYWIWVTGDTKPNKDALKAAGLQWHSKRKCWYYKPAGWKKGKRSSKSLEELAGKYGYRHFETAEEERVPARR